MPLTVSSKLLASHEMPGGEDSVGRRSYEEVFEVDQTDEDANAAGVAVAIAAQLAGVGDVVPLRGANYSRHGTTDLDSYVQGFDWKKPDPKNLPRRWHIGVKYAPLEGNSPGQLQEPEPLFWPVEYWVEWTEEQVPIETAKVVDDLDHVGRAADSDGPIVNSAGEQTIDPQLKTVYYPILCCQKAYATLNAIVDLNTAYQDSTNNGLFFGAPARTAKYLLTESGRLQRTQGVSFYIGITRIWLKRATWDRKVLNNGMLVLRRNFADDDYLADNEGKKPGKFRHMVQEVSYDPGGGEVKREYVPSPEPSNLNLNGTPRDAKLAAINLSYRYLTELSYAGIGIGS